MQPNVQAQSWRGYTADSRQPMADGCQTGMKEIYPTGLLWIVKTDCQFQQMQISIGLHILVAELDT